MMITIGLRQLSSTHSDIMTVILPHAGGSASYFRPWGAVADQLQMDLYAVQYPGHEDLFSCPSAKTLDEMADAVASRISRESRQIIIFGHSMGALLAHRATELLIAANRPPLALHVSASRAPDQRVRQPRHILSDQALVRSVGAMSPGEDNPLEDEMLASVLLPQLRHEMFLAESHHRDPAPFALRIIVHLGDRDPDFTVEDVPAWSAFTSGGIKRIVHSGHHFYLAKQAAEVLTDIRRLSSTV